MKSAYFKDRMCQWCAGEWHGKLLRGIIRHRFASITQRFGVSVHMIQLTLLM
jgi:hypothetical protein